MLKTFWSFVVEFWCKLMHPTPMWPVHGHYRCRACFREYPVRWEASLFAAAAGPDGPLAPPEDSRNGRNRIVRPVATW